MSFVRMDLVPQMLETPRDLEIVVRRFLRNRPS